VAIDSADVVLMNSRLTDVSGAVRLSRATLRNIHENLFWAFAYNTILIPMAAGLIPGVEMNPMWGAAAMALSSFTVCMNALRLNLFRVHDASRDRRMRKTARPEEAPEDAELTAEAATPVAAEVTVRGMMCEHCEMHVKKALEAIDGITSATASHKDALVTIETSKSVDENLIKAAVTDAGYEYAGVIA
jgi:Cu2+-exporting ATPase